MRVTKKKENGSTKITYNYKGDLRKEMESVQRELDKKTEEFKIIEAIYKKAKHEYDYYLERMEQCREFLRLAKEKLKEENESDQ